MRGMGSETQKRIHEAPVVVCREGNGYRVLKNRYGHCGQKIDPLELLNLTAKTEVFILEAAEPSRLH